MEEQHALFRAQPKITCDCSRNILQKDGCNLCQEHPDWETKKSFIQQATQTHQNEENQQEAVATPVLTQKESTDSSDQTEPIKERDEALVDWYKEQMEEQSSRIE